jgi:hypothetical protein
MFRALAWFWGFFRRRAVLAGGSGEEGLGFVVGLSADDER